MPRSPTRCRTPDRPFFRARPRPLRTGRHRTGSARTPWALAGALLLAAVTGGCGSSDRDDVLRVGMDLNYRPFEMRDPAGNPAGVSVDLAEALAASMDRPLRIVPMDFQGLLPALQSGGIDLVISSMTRTAERERQIAFSDPYVATGLCLLVSADSDITGITDLNQAGRTVVVRTGTTGHVYAQNHLDQATVLPQELPETCLAEVVNGNADAFIYDQWSVLEYAAAHPQRTRAIAAPFQIEHWAIGMRRGEDDLREQVNGFLEEFRRDGGFARIEQRYPELEQRRRQLRELGLPFIFQVGDTGNAPPTTDAAD